MRRKAEGGKAEYRTSNIDVRFRGPGVRDRGSWTRKDSITFPADPRHLTPGPCPLEPNLEVKHDQEIIYSFQRNPEGGIVVKNGLSGRK